MKKNIIFIFILAFLFQNICFGAESVDVIPGGISLERVINNAPDLIRYCALGEKEEVIKLLKEGADPNLKFIRLAPSFVAIYKNHPDILAILLQYGANPDEKYMGETLLGFSIYMNNFDCLKVLAEYGADINLKTLNKLPIEYAVKKKNIKMAEFLYNNGATVNKKTARFLKKNNISF